MISSSIELPLRKTEALPDDQPPLRRLAQRFEKLFDEGEIYYAVHTQTRVDVGYWFRQARVWAIATSGHLLLFARGKRPLAECIPYRSLQESTYNHVTGCLTFASKVDKRYCKLKMSPVDGYQMLAQIFQ